MSAPAQPVWNQVKENEMAMWLHLSALSGLVVPFGSILGPLIFWLVKKDQMPSLDRHGKEALNFQITVALAMVVSFVLVFILIGILMMLAVGIAALVFTILAGVRAGRGEAPGYPFSFRFLK
ncbi:MAG TPA: DUF4870 domain-containing protein [Candidatus Thermoplasmatota archaeon]|nr:DUF4870 domain-containing protein [Candidatus Thermoplasmatota archaeon]